MSACAASSVTLIDQSDCVFNSLNTINRNFESIDMMMYGVSSLITGKASTSVGKLIGGSGITISSNGNTGTGDVTVSISTCPLWYTGKTGKPLYDEALGSIVSSQYDNSYLVLQHLSNIVEQNYPIPGSESLVVLSYDYGPEKDKYCSSRLLLDGRVYLGPNYFDIAKIYDPITDTVVSSVDKSYPETQEAFSNCVYLPDGKIFLVPYNTIYARIYNPGQDNLATEQSSGEYRIRGAYSKGILTPAGDIFHVPFNSATDLVYSTVNKTLQQSQGTYPGNEAYIDGVLLPDNKILLVPYKTNVPVLFDLNVPYADPANPIMPLTFINTEAIGASGQFSGGVMMADGRVFLVPTDRSNALIYDHTTRSFTTASGTYPLGGTSIGGCLLADGRVLVTPINNNTIKIYDPRTDTLHDTGLRLGDGVSHSKGIVLKNGDVFFAPKDSKRAVCLRYYHQSNFSLSYLTGIYV
jgi:hypothetical protein